MGLAAVGRADVGRDTSLQLARGLEGVGIALERELAVEPFHGLDLGDAVLPAVLRARSMRAAPRFSTWRWASGPARAQHAAFRSAVACGAAHSDCKRGSSVASRRGWYSRLVLAAAAQQRFEMGDRFLRVRRRCASAACSAVASGP